MKTNQMMSIQISNNHTVQIGNLNDVFAIGNSYRKSENLQTLSVIEWLRK